MFGTPGTSTTKSLSQKHENGPAVIREFLGRFLILVDVTEGFLPPEFRVSSEFFLERRNAANRPVLIVPEVAVAENHYFGFSENNLGSAGQFCDVHAKTTQSCAITLSVGASPAL